MSELFAGVSWLEAIVFALTLVYALVKKLGYDKVLPKSVRDVIKKLGGEEAIERIILDVNAFNSLTEEQKRAEAVKLLKKAASDNGVRLPTSLANFLVEWMYGRLKGVI